MNQEHHFSKLLEHKCRQVEPQVMPYKWKYNTVFLNCELDQSQQDTRDSCGPLSSGFISGYGIHKLINLRLVRQQWGTALRLESTDRLLSLKL